MEDSPLVTSFDGSPSDVSPGVLRHGRTDVQAVVVSMSARAADGRDAEYLAWHGLDHLPEQHRIGSIRAGARWVSTPACRAARLAEDERFAAVDHVVAYLFAEPLGPGLDTFFALGADLRAAGRMPALLPSVELGGYELAHTAAADRVLVGADVLPWRPHRGVLLVVERGVPPSADGLLEVDGVAGCWTFTGRGDLHARLADTGGLTFTIVYLDDDPPTVAGRAAPMLTNRWAESGITPLLAAPFMTVVPWEWDAALP